MSKKINLNLMTKNNNYSNLKEKKHSAITKIVTIILIDRKSLAVVRKCEYLKK